MKRDAVSRSIAARPNSYIGISLEVLPVCLLLSPCYLHMSWPSLPYCTISVLSHLQKDRKFKEGVIPRSLMRDTFHGYYINFCDRTARLCITNHFTRCRVRWPNPSTSLHNLVYQTPNSSWRCKSPHLHQVLLVPQGSILGAWRKELLNLMKHTRDRPVPFHPKTTARRRHEARMPTSYLRPARRRNRSGRRRFGARWSCYQALILNHQDESR